MTLDSITGEKAVRIDEKTGIATFEDGTEIELADLMPLPDEKPIISKPYCPVKNRVITLIVAGDYGWCVDDAELKNFPGNFIANYGAAARDDITGCNCTKDRYEVEPMMFLPEGKQSKK